MSRVFGPADTSDLLNRIQSLAEEPSDSVQVRVQNLIEAYPLSHNLRLMAFAVLRTSGFQSEAMTLISDSVILYPESPLLLERYLSVSDALPQAVRDKLEERCREAKRRTIKN